MSPMNALALVLTLSLCASCATSPQPPPKFTTAQCPPAPVLNNRGFFNPPPACVGDYGPPPIEGGRAWLELAADAVKGATDRQICLNQVNDWIEAELSAKDRTGLDDE